MREIKFRAWDVLNKRMVKVLAIRFKDRMILEDKDDADWASFDDLIPLEYIDTKDKDGEEIYEGDIINVNDMPGPPEQCTVEYEYGGFKLIGTESVMEYVGERAQFGLKIIGNIYENSEL